MLRLSLSKLLSLNAGFVDTLGFLALHGLLAAHVTGNLVTFGAAVVLETSGATAKLLALPVFCAVIVVARLASFWLIKRRWPVLKTMLSIQVAFLVVAASLMVTYGPFPKGDGWQAVLVGLALIGAMAIQNAAHRIHFGTSPPTTMMTGNITQAMIDLADGIWGWNPDSREATRRRMVEMLTSVAAFASGCALAAAAFTCSGSLCFLIPPMIGLLALVAQPGTPLGKLEVRGALSTTSSEG
ncbi:YoaK family protein [Rhizobium tubonense]|uniref:DUF1275 family protein n=1 Tax=Rhizobium tubonense TaxID=484088 RepID=A0A2W4CSH1_9HYPH|nr:YoaK family protein [Rhizobium tubonense]PZM15379.1 hypothetical protein CPY51_07170 [Rhizobium tubonense]